MTPANQLPRVDKRTANDIAAELRAAGAPSDGIGFALVRIFSRYCEIAIDRINRAPDKNFLAYLDLLGNTLLPPEPARVPLTFSLAAGADGVAVVPMGTQVATKLLPGEQKPVLFETESELVVAPIRIANAIARDARTDLAQDMTALTDPASTAALSAFKGSEVMIHDLYIQLPDILFEQRLASNVYVKFTIAPARTPIVPELVWESWDGSQWSALTVWNDSTNLLSVSGTVELHDIAAGPRLAVNGITAQWVRCRWRTPISTGPGKPGMIPEDSLPTIQGIMVSSATTYTDSNLEAAFFNDRPLDLTRDFLPFGDHPKAGDAFYLMSPAFSRSQNNPILKFALTEGYQVTITGTVKVAWEFWNGQVWQRTDVNVVFPLTDAGDLNLTIASDPEPRTVNNRFGYWLRARLVAGDYGIDPLHPVQNKTGVAAPLSPPSYQSMTLAGGSTVMNQREIALVTCNDWHFESRGWPLQPRSGPTPFVPFQATTETTFSLGFSTLAGRPFPNRTVYLYVSAAARGYGAEPPDNADPKTPPHLTWQYWNGRWSSLTVVDGTRALTREGILEFLAPGDFASRFDAGAELYWIRALWDSGDYELEPKLRAILPNTVSARQAATLSNEILGSSTGSGSQTFPTARSPILPGQQLQIREPAMPTPEEQAVLESEEGAGAISLEANAIWVTWHEVPDFYESGPSDRHYVVDRLAGQVRFGDGQNGRIPIAGSNNLRLARYRTGGGPAGNRPVANITQMKTTVPYVDRVTNFEAATGGVPAEDIASLQARGPRIVRHGGRAVTAEDYEDLAKLASPAIIRAKCAPTRNLEVAGNNNIPGQVSLIVVPNSISARPAPEITLLQDVQAYVDLHRVPTADLTVVGPPFVRVDVATAVVLISLDISNETETGVKQALARYLNPLTGGRHGGGWDFGRLPHKSELYSLVASVPGVRFVLSLNFSRVEEPAGALASGYFLVYSGMHQVTLSFEG